MVPVGGAAHRQVSPWIFWGGFGACFLIIVGAWVMTLPIQWAVAEVPPTDPPRWSLLDAGDPAGRLKSQIEEVKQQVDESKKILLEAPQKMQQAERFRVAGQTMTSELEAQVTMPATTQATDTAIDSTPVLVTPSLTTKP